MLEEAGVVIRTIEARTHRLGLDLVALSEPVEWIDRQRAMWERMFSGSSCGVPTVRRSEVAASTWK